MLNNEILNQGKPDSCTRDIERYRKAYDRFQSGKKNAEQIFIYNGMYYYGVSREKVLPLCYFSLTIYSDGKIKDQISSTNVEENKAAVAIKNDCKMTVLTSKGNSNEITNTYSFGYENDEPEALETAMLICSYEGGTDILIASNQCGSNRKIYQCYQLQQ